jgi:sulfur-oxidizing protein SoxY
MHKPENSTRRQFLGLAGGLSLAGGAAVFGAVPMVTLLPAEATPAMLATAIRNVVGAAVVKTGKVKLDVPPLVENGNTVPMTISVASPMTQ